MADHIPFVTGEDAARLIRQFYSDSEFVRIPLDRIDILLPSLPSQKPKLWLDPCVDGMDDLEVRRGQPWFGFISHFPHSEKVATPAHHAKPIAAEVQTFVTAVLDECAKHKPSWITVPQLPVVNDSARNKINRALAAATGKWKASHGFAGRLILPLVFTHQRQVNGKTARKPKVEQAARCYDDAHADGIWVVDASLKDDSGSPTLRNKRFPGVIDLHEELNKRIASKIRIAGPYWGLNLALWARGLVDYPAIGIGSGYQFLLAGGHVRSASARVALPPLRRRVGLGPKLRQWLNDVVAGLAISHSARADFLAIVKNYDVLTQGGNARGQVARFYKSWFDAIASAPKAGRSMALFQDLSAAFAFGRSLAELPGDEGTARRPEAIAEPLMLSCL